MEKPPVIRSRYFFFAIAGMAAGFGALVVLFFFDPVTAGFYPVCPLYVTTGLLCPGCGGLRALHQLTHGHLIAAWRFNPFLVSLLPAGMWLALREFIRLTTGKMLPGIITRPIYGWLVVAGMVVFGILRNVPVAHLLAMSH